MLLASRGRTEEVMVSLERSSRVQRIGGAPVATPETTIGTVARYSDGVTLLLTGNAVSLDHGGTVRPRAQELHEGGHAIKSLDTSEENTILFSAAAQEPTAPTGRPISLALQKLPRFYCGNCRCARNTWLLRSRHYHRAT